MQVMERGMLTFPIVVTPQMEHTGLLLEREIYHPDIIPVVVEIVHSLLANRINTATTV
jgi:hypothetical protein